MTERRSPLGALTILAKAPGPGAKTRIAATIGAAAAAQLADAFLRDTLAMALSGPWQTHIAFSPVSARQRFEDLAPETPLAHQPAGDLGFRILHAMSCAAHAVEPVVLIGTDTPDLPCELIEEAFSGLAHADIVLGPAHDGGFYLIGAARPLPAAIFANLAWSTDTVFARTSANARALGLSLVSLQPWGDVDDGPSLTHLRIRLANGGYAPATRAALAAIEPPTTIAT